MHSFICSFDFNLSQTKGEKMIARRRSKLAEAQGGDLGRLCNDYARQEFVPGRPARPK